MVDKIKCHSISVDGAKHVEAKKPCQDSSGHFQSDTYAVISVSDGHGSKKHFRSKRGSEIAVAVAISCVKECFDEQVFVGAFADKNSSDDEKEMRLNQLKESIISRWNEAVGLALDESPFTEEELSLFDDDIQEKLKRRSSDKHISAYGATLLVAVVSNLFWFGVHIGDGTFVVKQNGEYSQPVPIDELCVGPYTTSLCSSDASRHFHHAWGSGTPEAILIASDGVDESFSSVDMMYEFYDTIIRNSVEDWDGNRLELEEYLPELSEKGSRDDVSLAWMVDMNIAIQPRQGEINKQGE